ncbi:MAG: 2-oxoacid:ferredoxin oxidoreductase subunit beta [Leptospiraceae bacterium]|nr:2-oxoacid:ferredoxin oxidoreductase subunit beta [Leptospiraceae bacterium]MCP5503375.1 2-oxoacid:ferredoxin oxidoreductase subunit beta [Leptospiraceae bacterium]
MTIALTKKDFASDQDVRWCPGCGDYGILSAIQKTMPELGIPKEKVVFISGIGCSSRFPYYMNTYGFHTIHGRAPSFATGVKITNPELSVWVITGDGDGLSIGGNHLIHSIRRNLDINIILFNNEIYGLTKGQYSPTSERGTVSKSSPYGSLEAPFKPISIALGAEASFVARTHDKNQKHMSDIFLRAAQHKGTSFVEVLQNCVIFNDGIHDPVYGREVREDNTITLEHGKPMIFGKNNDKGISLDGSKASIVDITKEGLDAVSIHDENRENPDHAFVLSRMMQPHYPVPMGVFRDVERPTYETQLHAQVNQVEREKGEGDLKKLLFSDETWEVK